MKRIRSSDIARKIIHDSFITDTRDGRCPAHAGVGSSAPATSLYLARNALRPSLSSLAGSQLPLRACWLYPMLSHPSETG